MFWVNFWPTDRLVCGALINVEKLAEYKSDFSLENKWVTASKRWMLLILKGEPWKWVGWKRRDLGRQKVEVVASERKVQRNIANQRDLTEIQNPWKSLFCRILNVNSRFCLWTTSYDVRPYECEIDMENYFSLHAFTIHIKWRMLCGIKRFMFVWRWSRVGKTSLKRMKFHIISLKGKMKWKHWGISRILIS